jgi:hypothetical protein
VRPARPGRQSFAALHGIASLPDGGLDDSSGEQMQGNKRIVVAGLAAALLIGGVAGVVTRAALASSDAPAPVPAPMATVSADTATPSGPGTDSQGSAGAEAPAPAASGHQAGGDGPDGDQEDGGQDSAGANGP